MTVVVEHGSSRSGRWLRRNRTRMALWIAVAEAVLILFGVVPKWPAFFVALLVLAFHGFLGRRLRPDSLREASWVAAISQLFIVALPFLIAALTLAAIVALGILVVVAVAVLFLGRR